VQSCDFQSGCFIRAPGPCRFTFLFQHDLS
jgi:hypothetical protein